MQKIKLALIILALILTAPNFNIVALSANPTSNVALLVGINKYPNLPARYQLHGCVNDVAMVDTLLCEKFQFDKNNIKILTDDLATRANILNQFREFLIANATSDGQAVFFYSGHGSRMTDLNGDEMDGWDETIVPYDSRDAARTVLDIPDDSLRALLGLLTEKCKNVTVIFDCCRSGSGIRGETAIPRQCEDLVLEQPKAKAAEIIKDGPSGFLPPDPDYVFISACRDKEYAYESYGHGALTLSLNEVMRQHPNATHREIMYKITEKVNAAHPSQHPQVEGKRRDAKIFGNLGVVENFVEVIKVENDQVQLNAGAAHNVTERSIYALYVPGTTSTKDETKYLGKVKISDVKPFTCWAKIEDGKDTIVKNAAAFEIAHHYGDLQLAVRLDMKDAPELEKKIEDILIKYKEKEDLVKLVSGKSAYDVNIRLDKNSNQLILERQDLTRLKEIGTDEQSIQYQLPDILTKEARRLNIIKLENKSDLQVDMIMERWEDVDKDFNPINKLPLEETAGGQRLLNVGDVIQLTIKNVSKKPIYVYLLDLGTDGSVSLLYPDIGAQDSPLPVNESIQTGLMRIAPPEGLDGLKVIATTVATDFSVLIQEGYRGLDDTQTTTKGMDSPLGKLLNLAWGGKRTVEKIQPKKIEDWTTEMISFMIKSKDKK